jgi:hypothetical protein
LTARLRTLLPPVWAGLLLAVSLLAAPAAFATLARADAGKVVGDLFAREAAVSLVAAVVFVVLERHAGGRPLGANVLLALGALFCTVAGYYALQPMMEAARSGQGALSFGQLHGISTAFFGLKTALVLAIAWRLSGPGRSS